MHKISNMKKTEEMKKEKNEQIELGVIGKAVGIDGRIRLNIYSGSLRNLRAGNKVILEGRDNENLLTISRATMKNGFSIIKFVEVNDRTGASRLTGRKLYILASDMSEPDEDEIYVKDLIGMKVYDRRSEIEVGVIEDVMTNRAQPIYVVRDARNKEVLIPGISEFVKEIDVSKKLVEVELIPGFI